jgi:hypothetical protein
LTELELVPSIAGITREYEKQSVSRAEIFPKWLQNPLVKATHFLYKYCDHESVQMSVVDCFVQTLFSSLGYNDGWLFTFPQFNLPLVYGNVQSLKRAKADLLVSDVLSFFCMSVVKDKILQSEMVSSEPQMVAEAIACSQSNARSKKRKLSAISAQANTGDEESHESSSAQEFTDDDGDIYGVRVNGFWWYFYVIPVSEALLTAMDSKCSPSATTTVHQCESKFDWRHQEDRLHIITVLDAMRQLLVAKAAASLQRRPFLSPSTKSITPSTVAAHT